MSAAATPRRIGLRVLLSAVAAAVALGLDLAPPARSDDATTAATGMCAQAKTAWGSQFETLYGSMTNCIAKATAIINAAAGKCGTANDAATKLCLQNEIQTAFMNLALGGGGENVATTQITADACSKLKAKLGARFAKTFGSVAGCKEKIKPDIDKLIADAAKSCQAKGLGAGAQESCILDTASASETTYVAKYSASMSTAEIVAQVADEVCGRLQTELGDRFAKKYGSLDGCKTQIAKDATPFVKDAVVACGKAEAGDACAEDVATAAAAKLADTLGLIPAADEIAAEAAGQVCARLQAELGDRFAKKYGSLAGCKAQALAKIAPYVRDQVAKCAKAADHGVCAAEVVAGANEKLAATLGLGPDLDDIVGEIAGEVCARLKSELGADRFAKEYKTADRCTTAVSQFARGFAADAIARCGAAANRTACTTAAMEEGATVIAEQYGPGPAETEIVKEIVAQACPRIKAQVQPKEWASKFPNDSCESVVAGGVKTDVHNAVARCSKAADRGACITTAVEDLQTKLIAFWAGPNVDQLADQVTQEACTRLAAQLGAAEFAARIGDARACGALVYKDARAFAEAAVKECKAAADKRACSKGNIATAEQALTKKLTTGPSVDELAQKTLQGTCDRLKAEVGANAAASVDCRRLLEADVAAAARAAVTTCVEKTSTDKGACIEARLRAAQPGFEKVFRDRVKFKDADVEKVVGDAAARACAETRALRGAKVPAGCEAKAEDYIRSRVYDFFKTCNGNETCVRGKVGGEIPGVLRYYLSGGQSEITIDQATTKVIDSFLGGTCYDEALAARVNGGVAGRAAFDKAFHAERAGNSGVAGCVKTVEPVYKPKVTDTVRACWAKAREDLRYDCIDAILQPLGKDLLKAIRAIFPPLPVKT